MMSLLYGFLGYNHFFINPWDRYKTTFTTRWGTYAYHRMPFGIINDGATFQRAMHIYSDDLIGVIIQIFLDDLTVHSHKRADHFEHLWQVFLRCRKYGISLNPINYIFGTSDGNYLGHIVSEEGVRIDPARVTTIQNLPPPASKKVTQAFMGKINFFRRFVPDFVQIAKPIHSLLRKYMNFHWNNERQSSFASIKYVIASTPVLAKPDFNKDF